MNAGKCANANQYGTYAASYPSLPGGAGFAARLPLPGKKTKHLAPPRPFLSTPQHSKTSKTEAQRGSQRSPPSTPPHHQIWPPQMARAGHGRRAAGPWTRGRTAPGLWTSPARPAGRGTWAPRSWAPCPGHCVTDATRDWPAMSQLSGVPRTRELTRRPPRAPGSSPARPQWS